MEQKLADEIREVALTHARPFTTDALFDNAWYWTIVDAARRLCANAPDGFPTREALTALHASAAEAASVPALTFVPYVRKKARKRRVEGPAQPTPIEALYDGSIACLHQVPTRADDWHDLFNALVFASFPRSKHALHARQLEQQRIRLARIERGEASPGVRTREQDTLTLFDEGGCVIVGTRETIDALWALPMEDFHAALASPDAPVPALFGHALFEHMVAGLRCPSAFACGLVVPALAPEPRTREVDAIDRMLAQALNDPARFADPSGLRRLHFDRLPVPRAGSPQTAA